MTSFWRAQPVIAIMVLFVVQMAVRFTAEINHDTAWYLYVAKGMLGGGQLYADYVEVNPPLGIWLTVPVVMLGRLAGIGPVEALYGVFLAVTGVSLLLLHRCLARIPGMPALASENILVIVAALFLFVPGDNFGQREHLLFLLFVPWLFLRFARFQDAAISTAEAVAIGAAGAIAICLKPHAVLAPAAVEALLLWRHRRAGLLLAAENIAAAAVVAVYCVAILILSPGFFVHTMELGIKAYMPYFGFGAIRIFAASIVALGVMAFGFAVLWLAPPLFRGLCQLALAAASGFLASYFIQAKGYSYQLLPAQILGSVAAVLALVGALHPKFSGKKQRLLLVPMAVAVCAVQIGAPIQHNGEPGRKFAAALAQYRPQAKSIYIASTNVFNGFPLALREGLVWASRFPCMWLAPYVSYHWRDGPLPDDPIVAYALDAAVTDLQKFRPEVVFINDNKRQDYVRDGTFDYLKFMSRDPRFPEIWRNYRLRGSTGGFSIYVVDGQ